VMENTVSVVSVPQGLKALIESRLLSQRWKRCATPKSLHSKASSVLKTFPVGLAIRLVTPFAGLRAPFEAY
jgi:hypothetical protein